MSAPNVNIEGDAVTQRGEKTFCMYTEGVRETAAVPRPKEGSPWSKGHCDFLLDHIDTQLRSMQGHGPRIKGSSWDGPLVLGETEAPSRPADADRANESGDRDLPSREVGCTRQLPLHLPNSREALSRPDSVCTEDMAAEFHKHLADLLLSSEDEEPLAGLALGPGEGRTATSNAAVLSGVAGPTFRSLNPALDSQRLGTTRKQLPAEASREKWGQELPPRSRERPLQSLTQQGDQNMASLGEGSALGLNCSAKSSSGVERGMGSQPWDGNPHARLQSSREEGGFPRRSGLPESERGGKGLERSSEWRQNIARSSKHQVSGEPPSSPKMAGRTTSKIGVPLRRLEVCHPGKTSSDLPGGEIIQPGPLGGSGRNLLLPLGGDDQGILPRSLHPAKAILLGRKEKVTLSELGTDPGIIYGLRGAQKPSGPARRFRETWVAALSTDVHGEVPEKGQTDGHNVKKFLLPPRDSWRSSSSSVSGMDEEGFAQLTSQRGWTLGSLRSWEGATAGNSELSQHMALKLETFQEAPQQRQELARRLELKMEDYRNKVDKVRADLVLLEYKREVYLKELVELEQELGMLRRQGRQYVAVQVEVSRLVGEREEVKEQIRCFGDQLSSLKLQLKSSRATLSSLEEVTSEKTKQLQEALLSKKDLEIARMHKTLSGLEVEKEALDGIVRSLKEEHQQQLKQLKQEASREKEQELCLLREELELAKKQALQELAVNSEEAKASALEDHAVPFRKEIEDLRKIVEEREAEVIQQQEAVQQQAKALKMEAREMVQKSLLQEQKKWEANAQAALQMQREALGEQERRRRGDLQRALEKERKLNGALQIEVANLRQKIEGLENQAHSLEEEKRASLEELQIGLQKEKDEALQRLQEELEKERMQEEEEMRARLRQMEEDQEHLQADCSRMSTREREAQAQAERMDHCLATQVASACEQLQELLPGKAGLPPHLLHRGARPLSSGTALHALREVREEIQSYVRELSHELERRRQCIFQIQREKELELRQQKEQLHLENQSVLEALKEQLVEEHMDDILTLQRSWVKEGQEKDKPRFGPPPEERVGKLRAAQKNAAYGKDKADPNPINEPKEAPVHEPEGCLSSNSCKNLATPGSEGKCFSGGWSRCLPPPTLCSSSLSACRSHPTSPGLLYHLQKRNRKLRTENGGYLGGQPGHPRETPRRPGQPWTRPEESVGKEGSSFIPSIAGAPGFAALASRTLWGEQSEVRAFLDRPDCRQGRTASHLAICSRVTQREHSQP